MPDEIKPGEMPNEQDDAAQDSGASELETLRKALAKANRESAERRKRLEALEAAEEQRKQGEMSELEKAQKAKADAESKAQTALAEANKRLIKAAFVAAASQLGVKNPSDAYALAVADGADISVGDDGEVAGAAEAVQALVNAGRLVTTGRPSAPSLDGAAGGGNRPATPTAGQLTEEEKLFAKAFGMTEDEYAKSKALMRPASIEGDDSFTRMMRGEPTKK